LMADRSYALVSCRWNIALGLLGRRVAWQVSKLRHSGATRYDWTPIVVKPVLRRAILDETMPDSKVTILDKFRLFTKITNHPHKASFPLTRQLMFDILGMRK
jgi:hypothetical protein